MTIEDIITARGIEEVLHFTTNYGLGGILATGVVKPRARLTEDKYLEQIYRPNCPDRSRDEAWHDYVNLSIARVNWRLLGISADRWHAGMDGWWCVLSFEPEILAHEGVYFTTTNNMYSGVRRAKGPKGLEAMYAERIVQWHSSHVCRDLATPSCQPTDYQAEVLYPGELSLDYLQHAYVSEEEHLDAIAGMCGMVTRDPIPCAVAAQYFA